MVSSTLFSLAATLALLQVSSAACVGRTPTEDVLYYDVAVIGGGSGGVYTATGLVDAGKKVVVIEKEDRLGGHANTFVDPASGVPINYGVQVLHNNDLVKAYFARYGLSTSVQSILGSSNASTPVLADWSSGRALTNVTIPSDPAAIASALITYATTASKYAPYLSLGFNLPDDVPEDLLLPFGDFVSKYNIAAAVPIISQIVQGIGNILELPTIYTFQYLPAETLQYVQAGFAVPADGKMTTLYDAAAAEFGNNVLLSSNVSAVDRTSSANVTLTVSTPTGVKTIVASKLVMAIQPTIDNLAPFLDLTAEETGLFSRFTHAGYWPMVVNDTGIPDKLAVNYYDATTRYNLPKMPGGYLIQPTVVPGLKTLYYATAQTSGPNPPAEDVYKEMTAGIARLAVGGAVATASSTPEVVAFKDHGAFCLQVSAAEIKAGFYKKLNALQGKGNTFWTGATWIAHDSAQIWKFSAALLPNITASMY